MLLAVAAACSSETIEVPGETVVVEKVVTETVEVPGETVVKEVVKEVMVPGETVVVEKEVVKTVEVPGETVTVEVVKEVQVPGETVVVEKEVVKTVEVPGQTVVVEKEVVKTVEVPGETVVVTKEVAVPVEVVREVPSGKNYVTDPTTGKVVTAPQYGGTLTFAAKLEPPSTDPVLGIGGSRGVTGVAERLGIVNWGLDREEFDLSSLFHSLSEYKGHLAESWETPDDTTIVLNIRQGVHWHDKPPMNGRELTAKDIEYNFDSLVKSLCRSNENKRTRVWVQYTASVPYTTPTYGSAQMYYIAGTSSKRVFTRESTFTVYWVWAAASPNRLQPMMATSPPTQYSNR